MKKNFEKSSVQNFKLPQFNLGNLSSHVELKTRSFTTHSSFVNNGPKITSHLLRNLFYLLKKLVHISWNDKLLLDYTITSPQRSSLRCP